MLPSSAAGAGLVGTWGTGKTYPTVAMQPFVTFSADGGWSASDGCNQVKGTWKQSGPGALVVTSGPHTMMACEGAPLPTAVANTQTYKIDAGKLTLSDKSGKDLVILVPQSAKTAPSSAAMTSK